ncbi:fibronectin type III domain protein [Krasilnikovia cinnamomea]|uniref:Fibronectin type III domain protein n=2 Tax=Krasilnikovia cinnamomea TaxID=349313 RepID=A0A4Q7ZSS4_9ACTN|nr:fibronectin type III domain protein [Krasilnikovia cinnamomea]
MPTGQSWIVVATGATPAASRTPTASPTPTASRSPARATSSSASPTAAVQPAASPCVGAHRPGVISLANVRPGTATAVVSWHHPGDDSVVDYRVTAISQDLLDGPQPQVPWSMVTPGRGCHTATATVTGLRPRTRYIFHVNADRVLHTQEGTQSLTVARSHVVSTT